MYKNVWIISMEILSHSTDIFRCTCLLHLDRGSGFFSVICDHSQMYSVPRFGPQAPLIWAYLCCKSLPPYREMFRLTAAKSFDRGSPVSYPPVGVCRLQITRAKRFTCGFECEHGAKNNHVVLKSVETLYMVTQVYCAMTL